MDKNSKITQYLKDTEPKDLCTMNFLECLESEKKEAIIELILYITSKTCKYEAGTDSAFLIYKSSAVLKRLFYEVEFSQKEIETYKHKISKIKSKIAGVKEKEATKGRHAYLAKSLKNIEKITYRHDKSEEQIFEVLKQYIDNGISVDYICDLIDKYSNSMNETNNGITIYDYVILKFLSVFPTENYKYEPYYFLKLLKKIKQKGVLTLDNIENQINKLKFTKLSEKDKLFILELEYLIKGENLVLEEEQLNQIYGKENIKEISKKIVKNTPYILGTYNNSKIECITIDPSLRSLKDDAISVVRDGSNYILGIHITAACEQIKENCLLDKIAKQNYKTMYDGPRKSSDMIEPRFSSTLFSLEEGSTKPCLSLYVVLSNDGEIKDYNFKLEEITITKNLTYEDTDSLIKNSNDKDVQKLLFDLVDITDFLKSKSNGLTYRKIKEFMRGDIFEDYAYSSHSLIGESMVLYNHLLAKEFEKKPELPFIYRVHNEPTQEEIKEIMTKITNPNSKVLPENNSCFIQLLREFYPKAEYSKENIGHYGLGLDAYCHGTSPGRRYSDLFIQRLYHDLIYKPLNSFDLEKYRNLVEEYEKMFNFQSEVQADYHKELALTKRKH